MKTKINTERFWRDGYLVLRQLFSPAEFQEMRERVLESLRHREAEGAPVVDALADPLLRDYLHDERLLNAARTILGQDDIVYFGDAGYAVLGHGYEAGVHVGGWHRDNTDRSDPNAPDWQGRYTLIRFGFYLQDHRRTSGGLMVRRKSHGAMIWGLKAHASERYLNNGMGDVGVWNMRIVHAGLGRQLRGFPKIALGPDKQKRVPEVLQTPYTTETRIGFWVSYGIDDAHLKRHCDYLVNRTERLEMWKKAHYEPDVLAACEAAGLKVIDMPARMRAMQAAGEPVGEHKHHYSVPY